MPGSIASTAQLPRPSALLWRILLASALVLSLKPVLGNTVVNALIPGFRVVYGWVDLHATVLDLRVKRNGTNDVLSMRANLSHEVHINGYRLRPFRAHPGSDTGTEGWYEITITTGGVLQSALMALIVILAWPASMRELLARIAVAVPLLCSVMLIETSLSLSANFWKPLHEDYSPNDIPLLVVLDKLMEGGGRLALGLLLSGAIVIFAHKIHIGRRARIDTDDRETRHALKSNRQT